MTDTTPGGWPDASKPGYPMHPEVSAWHWVARPRCKPEPTEYRVLADGDGYWWWNGSFLPAELVGKYILHYLGPCHTPAEVAALVEAARREEREANAAEVDCGCDNREAVLARLESQGEKRASYLCAHHCSALQAAAIRARSDA